MTVEQQVEQIDEVEEAAPLLVEWKGEQFELADEVLGIVYMDYVREAARGTDAETLDGLATTFDMVEACLTPDAWQRFRKHARETKATPREIVDVIGICFEARANRPTTRPADSSDGSPPTSPTSTDDSSLSRVLDRIPASRPDLKLATWQGAKAAEAEQAASA